MQLTSTFAAALLTFVNVVFADSPEFGIVSIHSASAAHLLFITDKDGLYLSGGTNALSSIITDDGKLKFSNGKYAVVGSDGKWTEGTEAEGSTGFAIANSALTYKGSNSFFAVPSSNAGSFYISENSTNDAIGVLLTAWTPNGSRAADYTPTGSDSTSASAVSSATAASTTAATVEAVSQINDGQVQATTATTVAAVSQIGDGQVQATQSVQVQSENGAAQYGISAGVLAAVAALLF